VRCCGKKHKDAQQKGCQEMVAVGGGRRDAQRENVHGNGSFFNEKKKMAATSYAMLRSVAMIAQIFQNFCFLGEKERKKLCGWRKQNDLVILFKSDRSRNIQIGICMEFFGKKNR